MTSSSSSQMHRRLPFETDHYLAFTFHRNNNSYCNHRRPPPSPQDVKPTLIESARAIEQILCKRVLCRHDIDELNSIYNKMESLERGVEILPDANTSSILQRIKKTVTEVLSSPAPKASDLITLYYLSRFQPLNLSEVSISARVSEKIAQHPDQNCMLRELASQLPCCFSEEIFNEDIKALIGQQATPEIREVLEQKKRSLEIHETLLKEIERRKSELADLRVHSSSAYPSYLDELLEHGLIHLYDHILEMRGIADRNQRKEHIRQMSFSDLCHIVLETRSAILHKVLSVLPKIFDNVIFLVGATGSGKSTTLRFLMGDQLELKNFCYDSLDQPGVVGHNDALSETLLPNVGIGDNLAVVDFPGFGDTHGPLVSLGVELALIALILEYHPKILILKPILDTGDKGAAAGHLGALLSRLLGKESKNRCAIGITKYAQNPHFMKMQQGEKKLKKIDKALSKIQGKIDNLEDKGSCSSAGPEQTDKLRSLHKKQQKYQSKRVELEKKVRDHPKTLQGQEAFLCQEIGVPLTQLIPFDNLANETCLERSLTILSGIEQIDSVNPEKSLDSDCKDNIIKYLFEHDLMVKAKNQSPALKENEVAKFEQEVLESSLTKVLFSTSNPEIGAFLHLPEIDPKVVRHFDKKIVADCISECIKAVISTSTTATDPHLVNNMIKDVGDKVPEEVKTKLETAWNSLQQYVIGLLGEKVENQNPKGVSQEWETLHKRYKTTLEEAETEERKRWELPAWATALIILPIGIPAAILGGYRDSAIPRRLNQLSADEGKKLFDEITEKCNNFHAALVKLKNLEAIVARREEIDEVFATSKYSFESLPGFNGFLLQKISKVRKIYSTDDWDARVKHMENVLLQSISPLALAAISSLNFFMILAIEALGGAGLQAELLAALEKEGLTGELSLKSILAPAQLKELTQIFKEAWNEELESSSLIDQAIQSNEGPAALERELALASLVSLMAPSKEARILKPRMTGIGLRMRATALKAGTLGMRLGQGFYIGGGTFIGVAGIVVLAGTMESAVAAGLALTAGIAGGVAGGIVVAATVIATGMIAESAGAEAEALNKAAKGLEEEAATTAANALAAQAAAEKLGLSSCEPENIKAPAPWWVNILVASARLRSQLLAEKLDLDLNSPLSRALLQAVLMKNCKLFSQSQESV